MDDQLRTDIISYLTRYARGRAQARPRAALMDYLRGLGYAIGDRTLRRTYETIPEVGHSCSTPKGIFWIVTAEDRKATTAGFHSKAISELVREKRVRDAAPGGQLELWEERA